MKQAVLIAMVCLLFVGLSEYAVADKLPVINGKVVVATVNDEPITIEEFNRTIAASHAGKSEDNKTGRIDYSAIMNRLINMRLILLEARNIGLDGLPEVRDAVEKYSKKTIMQLVVEEHVKDVKADKQEIENIYRKIVREWKIKSIIFDRQVDAKKIEEKIKVSNNFDEIAEKAVEEGIAKGADEGFLQNRELKPAIARLVSKMEIGAVSPIVSLGKNQFMLFKLEGTRFPEDRDHEAWKLAKRQAVIQKKVKAAVDYYYDLRKKYVRMNDELFKALDYESENPGFENLLMDTRVIAEIDGEEPITVGRFSEAIKEDFYHGVQLAIQNKKINAKKNEIMEDILQKRVLLKEGLTQGIDKTELYRNKVSKYENSMIFDTFINKVIIPDVKLNLEELKSYYQENSEEYTYPEMMRIRSLVFRQSNDALNAKEKLIKGTDFNWLSANAEGQMDKNSEGLLKFEGALLTVKSLPEEVRKALSRAKPGDFRSYESLEGYFYVLHIYDVIPARPQPFENVKKEIAERVFSQKLKKAVEDYAAQLRAYYPVKIYAKELQ